MSEQKIIREITKDELIDYRLAANSANCKMPGRVLRKLLDAYECEQVKAILQADALAEKDAELALGQEQYNTAMEIIAEKSKRIAALEQQLKDSEGCVERRETYIAQLEQQLAEREKVEPVAEIVSSEYEHNLDFGRVEQTIFITMNPLPAGTALYTHPQRAEPVAVPDERAAFEDWAWGAFEKRFWWDLNREPVFRRRENGDYISEFLQVRFEAWQARSQLSASPQPVGGRAMRQAPEAE